MKISVLTPCYNAATTLERAIQSEGQRGSGLFNAKRPDAFEFRPDGVQLAHASHRERWDREDWFGRAKRRLRKTFTTSRNQGAISSQYKNAIWHSTFFTLDPRIDQPNVVSVYDMIAEKYFHLGGSWAESQIYCKNEAIRRADQIIAISSTTANEARRFYPELSQKIHAIPLGADHLTLPSKSDFLQSSDVSPYALFVGARGIYKNFILVIESLASTQWPADLKLKVVGAPFSQMEIRLLDYYRVSHKIVHEGRVTDRKLSQLYQGAVCFIFPSLDEGFGIPVIESQINACVPVLSDIPVFREVAGDGAIYFNPRDPESLCLAVHQYIEHVYRDSVLIAAESNLRHYSWDNSAKLVLESYARLAALALCRDRSHLIGYRLVQASI